MEPVEMEEIYRDKDGNKVRNRFRKVGNNLRKFGQLEGEEGSLRDYHKQVLKDGLKKIQEEGIRVYCRRMSVKYDVSDSTIKGDYSMMKRYRLIGE
jgi:hypothetical protein